MTSKPIFALAFCVAYIATAGPLFAVIEPSSTPADIVRQATIVAAFSISKLDDQYAVDRESIVAIKGEAASATSLKIGDTKEFTAAAALSAYRVVMVAAKVKADSNLATKFVLAGNKWFELAPSETDQLSPKPASAIAWFFGAGVDVLEPALKHAVATKSARFPTASAEKWLPLFTRKMEIAPLQLLAVRSADNSRETLRIIGSEKTTQASWQRGEDDFTASPADHAAPINEPPRGERLTADFNNDGKADVLSVGQECLVVQLGGDGAPKQPIEVAAKTVTDVSCLAVCDLDRDGNLDFIAGGKNGCRVFFGSGDAMFREATYACGADLREEMAVVDLMICDRNGDRHDDLIILAKSGPPRVLSNLGFGVFQKANFRFADDDRKLPSDEWMRIFSSARFGQPVYTSSSAAADWSFINALGELAVLRCDQAAPILTVSMHGSRPFDSPTRVVAYEGGVCLGARNLTGDRIVQFAKFNKGPLDLKWMDSAGVEQKKRLIVLKPLAWELPSTSKRPTE